jgi:Flp pilus assembly protein TadG
MMIRLFQSAHLVRSRTAFLADESGTGLAEIVMSTMALFVLIFGILDCSRALYADHFISHVAREATRYAMVRGSTWNNASCTSASTYSCTATAANVTSYVKSVAPVGIPGADLVVNTTWPGTTASGASCTSSANSPGCVVTVQVSYSFNFVLPFLPKNAMVLSSSSAVAISQ